MKFRKRTVLLVSLVLVLLLASFLAGRLSSSPKEDSHAGHSAEGTMVSDADDEVETWTCSMHPQIKLPEPGKCPICFMDLIPLESGDEDMTERELRISDYSKNLMEIETVPVERRFVTADVRMVGKVDYNETLVSYITARVPGRIDRLFVDYTGIPVREGDHMASLYSPELLSAQEELIQAVKTVERLKRSGSSVVRETSEATVAAAREKLRLWGFSKSQIDAIEERGTASDHMTVYAPAGGIVIDKNAKEGMYVDTGTRIYTIADLSQVWVKLDAYESDLAWLKYGQEVEFTAESYPGETFTGRISFIHPVLNEATRTVKVRLNVPNEDGRLKPGMFVRAVSRASVASGGRVMDPELAGKWVCPMHPSVVKEHAGDCDICGMPLVRTENLGYVASDPAQYEKPLVIPATVPLLTGQRAVVYVEVPQRDKPTYEGREVVLGPRAGNCFIVESGLQEGEQVVVNGNFKLDAELQIQAKPSMMSARDDDRAMDKERSVSNRAKKVETAKVDSEFRQDVGQLLQAYLEIQQALADDDIEAAVGAAETARTKLAEVDMELLEGKIHMEWMKHAKQLKTLLYKLGGAEGIEAVRREFSLLSEEMLAVAERFGVPEEMEVYNAWCPMAFDNRGANWIQAGKVIDNPYFGEAMLKCGEIKKEFGGE